MPNNGAVAGKITQKDGKYTIPMGFHDGSGSAAIDETEQAKLVPANIREGVTNPGRGGFHVLLRGHEAPGQERGPDL